MSSYNQRQWLVTNGLGGYASGPVSGPNDWKYHGLLVSAEPPPLGRMVMLADAGETISDDGAELALVDAGNMPYALDHGLPVWRYILPCGEIERIVFMIHGANTVCVLYRAAGLTRDVTLVLHPQCRFRQHEANFEGDAVPDFAAGYRDETLTVTADGELPVLRLKLAGSAFTPAPALTRKFFAHDHARGNDPDAMWWTPGTLTLTLRAGGWAALIATTESGADALAIDVPAALEHEIARRHKCAAAAPALPPGLVIAADQFVIDPRGRNRHRMAAADRGEEIRAIVAGYHWFTDWGRDTMIALEGLTLVTNRPDDARRILLAFADYIRDGLVPNFFPDGDDDGVYHTADATLWYFHALARYVRATADVATLAAILPRLVDIAEKHVAGTRYGIHVDPADRLLVQGADGYQLTWMDAKVDGWVVTPRRGKAVEINALWYNALRLLEGWLDTAGDVDASARWRQEADEARTSFNARFWNEAAGCLYDVVDGAGGDDAAIRPNQLFALSLDHPVLAQDRWEAVLDRVRQSLVTPFGLRTLAPEDPEFQSHYFGNLRARDAAYHQGTVWPWLIGPFIDAWLRVHPTRREEARAMLASLGAHAAMHAAGSIHEIFDAVEPFTPRGCISQAWSVAELLRALARLDEAMPAGDRG